MKQLILDLSPQITVICATKRPHLISRLLTNLSKQQEVEWRAVICLHGCILPDNAAHEVGCDPRYRVLSFSRGVTLGAMLNRAVWEVDTDFVCKWDDDDFYGRWFLYEAVQALAEDRGDLVGKASWYAWIEAQQSLFHRFAGSENQPQTYLAGGTLAARSALLRAMPFVSANFGEDQALVRDVIQRRGRVWATGRHGYVQVRGDEDHNHAWSISVSDYLVGCTYVGPCLDLRLIEGEKPTLSPNAVAREGTPRPTERVLS